MAVLYTLAKSGLDGLFGIAGNGLELVYSHNARLVGMLEICENLVERSVWSLNVADADAPFRIAVYVERNGRFERLEHVDKEFPRLPSLRFQSRQNALAQSVDKFVEVLRVVNVNEDAMVLLAYRLLIEAVMYQSRLAQATLGYQRDVASVGEMASQQGSLVNTVAEIFRRQIAFYDKWIGLYHKLL